MIRKRVPHPYEPGDRVRDIYTGAEYTVKRCYWQEYAGGDTADYTVEFEPTADQPTPWDKSTNLEPIDEDHEGPLTAPDAWEGGFCDNC